MLKVEGGEMNGKGCKPVAWGPGGVADSECGVCEEWTSVLCATAGSWAPVLLRRCLSTFFFLL